MSHLLPHRTLLSNLQKTRTAVALELMDRIEMGLIIVMTFHAVDAELDEITLSRHAGVLCEDATVHWGEVNRIWTPTWTRLPSFENYHPVPVDQEPAAIVGIQELRARVLAARPHLKSV